MTILGHPFRVLAVGSIPLLAIALPTWGQGEVPKKPKIDPALLTPDGRIDPKDLKDPEAKLTTGPARTLVESCQFTEGPLWLGDGTLIFSDIPASKVYKLAYDASAKDATPKTPKDLQVFRDASGRANGNALDKQGRVVSAESDGRVTRTEVGKTEVLAKEFEGKRLNSPNDVVVRSDGTIYFTDPPFFVKKEERQIDFAGVYRLAPDGKLSIIFKDFERCNGLCLSPDEKRLYVNDSSTGRIQVFDVGVNGDAGNGRLFATAKDEQGGRGGADGMKCDVLGNVYTTGPRGIWAFAPDGTKIEVIEIPDRCTNLCFGGADGKTMFITTGKGVVAVPMKNAGAGVK